MGSCSNSSEDSTPELIAYSDSNCSRPIIGPGADDIDPWAASSVSGSSLSAVECTDFPNNEFARIMVRTISIEAPAYSYLSDAQMTSDYHMFKLECGVSRAPRPFASWLCCLVSLLSVFFVN